MLQGTACLLQQAFGLGCLPALLLFAVIWVSTVTACLHHQCNIVQAGSVNWTKVAKIGTPRDVLNTTASNCSSAIA